VDPRHRARECALQMLYQWEVGRLSMVEVRQTFWSTAGESAPAVPAVRDLATRLADGVATEVDRLDPIIVEAAEHWRLERMNVVDRLILRLATYEMLHEADTPAKVVINEALELARAFSGDDAVRFINGVLDAIRRTLQRA
jgi:transcription antitermination protein NusB